MGACGVGEVMSGQRVSEPEQGRCRLLGFPGCPDVIRRHFPVLAIQLGLGDWKVILPSVGEGSEGLNGLDDS